MIQKIIKEPEVDSPKGKTNWKDWLVSLKSVVFSKIGLFWIGFNTFFEAFFGPEFFTNVANWCTDIGLILPKNSASSIIFALTLWGLGSAFIYFAKLRERKRQGE